MLLSLTLHRTVDESKLWRCILNSPNLHMRFCYRIGGGFRRLKDSEAHATKASAAEGGRAYRFVYVDQEGYERNPPKTLASHVASFTGFQKD